MQDTIVAGVLRRVPLFSKPSEGQFAWISNKGTEVYLGPGEKIASQGDPPDGFYVILEGHTEWTREVGEREVRAVRPGPGEVFAELILFLDAPYPTTGRALDATHLFKLEPDAFWEMLGLWPQVLRSVLAIATERSRIHESVSQQQARLISLGNMAACPAHELNNPAAAVRRSASDARESFSSLSPRAFELAAQLPPEHRDCVSGLPEEIAKLAKEAPDLDALQRSDREDGIADWLDERGVGDAFDLAPILTGAGPEEDWSGDLAERVPVGVLGGVLSWLATELTGDTLPKEIESGAGRIFDLVGAVKEYSYVGHVPSREEADVREGIENTPTILGHKLKRGNVAVTRNYATDLPRVVGYGRDLTQVWTNLLDSAIDAAGEAGRVGIRAARENLRLLVEVSGDGSGIPEEVKERIFEPFFTTKEVGSGMGSGMGLGLDIARRAVEEHGGEIRAVSKPGATRMEVRLPVEASV
jgi:signal transduction histidine kinase